MKATDKLERVRGIVKRWAQARGHDRCWYYPELFMELCRELDIEVPPTCVEISEAEFKEGCNKFRKGLFK